MVMRMDRFDLEELNSMVRAALTPADDPEHEMVTISVHFFDVQVNKNAAEAIRSKLVEILNHYPAIDMHGNEQGRLQDGLSYIAIGSAVGSQELALILLAVGEACGLWQVVTPERLGMEGQDAANAAGMGLVMASGYQP